jgi:hypothetical protein
MHHFHGTQSKYFVIPLGCCAWFGELNWQVLSFGWPAGRCVETH